MNNQNKSQSKKAGALLSGLVEYLTVALVKDARAKVKKTVGSTLKKTAAGLVLVLGFIFLLVGLAQLIGAATGYGNGAGYAIVGVIVIFLAWAVLTANKK